MILDQLTLRNFGLFRGRQVLELAPVERHGKLRPIVLFGGINGGGKTTLFDAIQLALYGPRARCSKRAGLAYDEFLRRCVHHGVPPEEGAEVALAFRHVRDGEEANYEVRRRWWVEGGRMREDLLVLDQGLPNYSVSRNWPQLIEEMIPLDISHLFFFDGEKIRTLAEDASSSAVLGAAIKALLGLDIVERLIADATVLQARLARQSGTPEHRAQVEELAGRVESSQSRVSELLAESAALENRRQRAADELEQAEAVFAAAGGRHWDAREDRMKRLGELASQAKELDAQLLALAGGELPLALVPDLLAGVAEQDTRERQAAEAEAAQGLLAERDARLLEALRAAGAPPGLCRLVHDHLAADRAARRPASPVPRRHGLSEQARALLRQLQEGRRDEPAARAGELLDRLGQVTAEREDLERALTATPEEGDVRQVAERFKAAAQQLAVLNDQAGRLKAALTSCRAELAEHERKLRALWQGDVEKEFRREDLARMVQLAGRTRDAMQEFLRRATAQKIDRLSALITESFRFLLRKATLVERVHIDPATFAVTLYDDAGHDLPRQRLSEGEKQIFAIALLWGLARASAVPLPAVIDTPMARLDAAHRRRLVERYFPNASHQVILLSTDTEVDRQYYEALRPALARAYHLNYDEGSKATVAEEGYFWKD